MSNIYLLFINVTSVSSTKQYIRQDKQYCQPFMGLQVTVQRQVYAFYRHCFQRNKIGGTHINLHSMTHNIIKSCRKTTVLVHNFINGAISPVQWPDRRSNHGGQPTLAYRTPGCNRTWGIHRGLVNSQHKWPVTRKMFRFMTSSCATKTTVLHLSVSAYLFTFSHLMAYIIMCQCVFVAKERIVSR